MVWGSVAREIMDMDNLVLILITVMLTEFGRDMYGKIKSKVHTLRHESIHVIP